MNYQVFADNLTYRTVMTLSLILLIAGCRSNDPLERYLAKTSTIQGFKAEIEITVGQSKPESVSIVREFPNGLSLSARNSRLAFTAKGGIDISDSEKLYDLLPPINPFFVPPSRNGLNWGTLYMIGFEAPTFRKIFSEKLLKADGQKDGISFYKFVYKTPGGDASYRFGFSSEGDIKSMVSEEPGFKINYSVKSYTILDQIPPETFALVPPDGYVQLGAPVELIGLSQGLKFPVDQLIVPTGKTRPTMKKPTLFAFINSEDPKAAETKAWLKARSKSVEVVTVIEGKSDSDFSIEFFDNILTGTPTFCLVKSDGIVEGVWMGFSNKIIQTTEKELEIALKSLKG